MFQNLKKELGIKNFEHIEVSDIFWISDKDKHQKEFQETNGNCCFNHQIGLPTHKVTEKEMPLFGYEMDIIDHIERYKDYILVKGKLVFKNKTILCQPIKPALR